MKTHTGLFHNSAVADGLHLVLDLGSSGVQSPPFLLDLLDLLPHPFHPLFDRGAHFISDFLFPLNPSHAEFFFSSFDGIH